MFAKVHKPNGDDNKGSVSKLAEYLDKENEGKSEIDKDPFFNHSSDNVERNKAISMIDNNNKNLGIKDAKFYMLTVNPSQDELKHLIAKTTGREMVNDFSELTKKEQSNLLNELKTYTRDVMDRYAVNFSRPNITSGANLVYFAKVETSRFYKYEDKLVKENKEIAAKISALGHNIREERSGANNVERIKYLEHSIKEMQANYHKQSGEVIKTGLKKEGLQLHVHVVVSRNDVTQKTKLSPLSKSKGGMQKLNGKDVMQGFNHEKFKRVVGQHFNEKYQYKSKTHESYESRKFQNTVGVLNDVGNDMAVKVKSKVVSEIKKEVLQGHFSEELNVVRNAKNVIRLIKSPQKTLVNMAKNKLLGILKGSILER